MLFYEIFKLENNLFHFFYSKTCNCESLIIWMIVFVKCVFEIAPISTTNDTHQIWNYMKIWYDFDRNVTLQHIKYERFFFRWKCRLRTNVLDNHKFLVRHITSVFHTSFSCVIFSSWAERKLSLFLFSGELPLRADNLKVFGKWTQSVVVLRLFYERFLFHFFP